MHLMYEDLARAQLAQRLREAEQARRGANLAAARRWQRRAESASRRARLALAVVQ